MEENRTHLSWENRENDLKEVERYGRFSVMFYRDNLLLHSRRVEALLESVAPVAQEMYPELDVKKARLIARYHDDLELQPFLGDVPLQFKLKMTKEELKSLRQKEVRAAQATARSYPKKVGGYDYLQLLLHAIHKDCMEAQLVSAVDKVDGYCTALHEVLAGNTGFLEAVINYNVKTFSCWKTSYPLIEKVFSSEHPLLSVSVIDLCEFFAYGERCAEPHTMETITRKTGVPMYEEWKRVTIETFGVGPLVRQTEFHRMQPRKEIRRDKKEPVLLVG